MPDSTASVRRPARLLDLIAADGSSAGDPAALGRAIVRLAHLAAAEHRARVAADAVNGAGADPFDAALRVPANGLAGGRVVPPLDRAIAINPNVPSGAVITEDDR